jgi:hypothetical protein
MRVSQGCGRSESHEQNHKDEQSLEAGPGVCDRPPRTIVLSHGLVGEGSQNSGAERFGETYLLDTFKLEPILGRRKHHRERREQPDGAYA